ncbi:hypothetical protein CPB84DRAFT_1760792 [Gymnopilus junonius]|uniref:Uncharacterized protein n=1 Tax=Gymnopilus junonius TaxID=109634 RepID=A0A9P5NZ34_GYMJU|nr:hypothetical protein CPB84DRAFT_1760792 [Gymnopilus junonius]
MVLPPHPSLKSIEILELCSSLHTLHRPLDESAGNLRFDYEAVERMLLHQILSRWILPSLTHLILDSPPVRGSLDDIWEKFGQQLEVVEFGKHTMQVHPSVSVVGLHAEVNGLLSNGDSVWGLIESHFEVLSGPKFPGLRRIILYGNWKPILGHRRFAPMRNKVWQNGRVLEFPDETRI